MNIFVTCSSPKESAQVLPDKHIVKMPLECCQMLSIVASDKWGHGYGELHRTNREPYKTEKGAFRNHPCTKWASESIHNSYWLIKHGLHMCHEYTLRYDKVHSCYRTLVEALDLFPKGDIDKVTPFVFAGPDEFKLDTSIDIYSKYKMYIASKPWVCDNYRRIPERKPEWV